jgi:diguanylate cyclase (GGDEF)-like protein
MKLFLYMQINGFALVVLLLVLSNMRRRSGGYLMDQRLFLALLGANMLSLVLDSVTWVLDGRPGMAVWALFSAVTALIFFVNPLICLLWLVYVDYQIFRDQHHLRREWALLLLPAAVNGALSVLSVNSGYLFSIDGNNVYRRGEFFLVTTAVCFFYLIGGMVLTVSNRKRLPKDGFFVLLLAALLPFAGGIIQSMFFGVSLVWVGMTTSVLIIFIHIQNDQLYTDHLTGLYNRRQLDHYLRQCLQSDIGDNRIVGLMIDLDSFKKINDIHGHLAGDQALEQAAGLLCKTFRQNDFIARYGGDEFIVIMRIKSIEDISPMLGRLRENIDRFNAQKLAPYAIDFSVGWDVLDGKSEKALQLFLQNIDKRMYLDKQRKESKLLAENPGG